MLALDQFFQFLYFIIKLRYLVSELKAKSELVIVFLPLILFYFTARIKISILSITIYYARASLEHSKQS